MNRSNHEFLPGTAWLGSFPLVWRIALAAILGAFPLGAIIFSIVTGQLLTISSALILGCLTLVSWYMLAALSFSLTALFHAWQDIFARIGRGDFSARLTPQGGNEEKQAAGQFNDMARNVGRIISDVRDSTSEVAYATMELRAGASQVSDAASLQSDSASQTATAIEEMTASITHIASQSHEAEQTSHAVSDLSAAGSRSIAQSAGVAQELAKAIEDFSRIMDRLAQSSDEVGQATGVIRGISEQTNLLALNAAIEAARAGETGRGFAVVADEVRKLAQRSNTSASEITNTVIAIQAEIREAAVQMAAAAARALESVVHSNEASDALAKIDAQAITALNNVHQISSGTRQQSDNSSTIVQHIDQIAQSAQANSKAAAETAEMASHLEYLTANMRNTLAGFRE